MKINQSTFIISLIIEKKLIECNVNIISMIIKSAIKIFKPNNYNKIDFHTYQ